MDTVSGLAGRCERCDVDLTSPDDASRHMTAFHPNYRLPVEFHRSTWVVVFTAVALGLALTVGVVWYALTGGAR